MVRRRPARLTVPIIAFLAVAVNAAPVPPQLPQDDTGTGIDGPERPPPPTKPDPPRLGEMQVSSTTSRVVRQIEVATPTAVSASSAQDGTDGGGTKTMSVIVPIVIAAVIALAVGYFLFWGRWHNRRARARMAALRSGLSAEELATASLDGSATGLTGTSAEAEPGRQRRRRGLNLGGGLGRSESGRSIRTLPEYTKEAGDEERVLLRRDPSLSGNAASHGHDRNTLSSPTQHARRLSEMSGLSVVTEGGEVEVANAPLSWGAAPSYHLGYEYGYGDVYDPPSSPPPAAACPVLTSRDAARSPASPFSGASAPAPAPAYAVMRSAPPSQAVSTPPRVRSPLHASTPPPARSASYAASSRNASIASRHRHAPPARSASAPPVPPLPVEVEHVQPAALVQEEADIVTAAARPIRVESEPASIAATGTNDVVSQQGVGAGGDGVDVAGPATARPRPTSTPVSVWSSFSKFSPWSSPWVGAEAIPSQDPDEGRSRTP